MNNIKKNFAGISEFVNRQKNVLIILILVQIIIVYFGYTVQVRSSGNAVFLADDGYYKYANSLVTREKVGGGILAPGFPMILSVLFLFPVKYHPVLRVTVSLLFSIGVLFWLFLICKKHITIFQFFLGSLLFIFNVSWIHYVLKQTPEVFLSFFLGMFIWALLEYCRTMQWKYIVVADVAFICSIFIKPVFIFIPVVLLLYSLVKRKFMVFSIITFIVSVFSLIGYSKVTSFELKINSKNKNETLTDYNSLKNNFIVESFWYDFIIRNKQFHKGMKLHYREGSFYKVCEEGGQKFVRQYYEKNPDGNITGLYLNFIKQHPWMTMQKILVSPIFYFILSTAPIFTKILIPMTLLSFLLSSLGVRKLFQAAGPGINDILIVLLVLMGFSIPYLVFHAYDRYSMPILPYLYVWGGNAFPASLKYRNMQEN